MVDDKTFSVKVKEVQQKYSLSHYEVLQRFMFERILERISISKYKDNFILKGGLLLSTIFGIENRTTKDMDTTIKGIDISQESMMIILNEILSIDLKDGVRFKVVDVSTIREDTMYGGNKYHILGVVNNTKVNLEIDISTGDKITPRKLKYKYPLLFENRSIIISSYNIETILAEKIETILRRGIYNSRMKDYYDIYFFIENLRKEINVEYLKQAINNTLIKRDSYNYFNDYHNIILSIRNNEKVKKLWKTYSRKNNYAKDIEIEEILSSLEIFLNNLYS